MRDEKMQPWRASTGDGAPTLMHGSNRLATFRRDDHGRKALKRAVACVNALEGWADPSAAGELLEATRDALTALEDHVSNDAKHYGIPEGEICPCTESSIPRLRAAIARAKGEGS